MDKATEELREQIAKYLCHQVRPNNYPYEDWVPEADQVLVLFNQWLEEQGALKQIHDRDSIMDFSYEPLRLDL